MKYQKCFAILQSTHVVDSHKTSLIAMAAVKIGQKSQNVRVETVGFVPYAPFST